MKKIIILYNVVVITVITVIGFVDTTSYPQLISSIIFFRLIGSAGVSVFLLSIFTGKAEAAFFGSNPGPGTVGIKDSTGTLIDPSEKKPTDGYNISQIDDAIPSYYGYVNKDGAWYIIKEDATGAYRYVKGTSSFSTNWTDRAVLTYDYFNSIF